MYKILYSLYIVTAQRKTRLFLCIYKLIQVPNEIEIKDKLKPVVSVPPSKRILCSRLTIIHLRSTEIYKTPSQKKNPQKWKKQTKTM